MKTTPKKNKKETPFEKVVRERLETINHLLMVKGKEYVRGDDRYHNFTRSGEMNRQTPTRALHGMNTKHLVSMLDMLDDIDAGSYPTEKAVNEKFGDIMVYLVILEALIKDRYIKKST